MAGIVAAGLGGCSSQSLTLDFRDNDGSTRTTAAGEAIQPHWLWGKWDLDGELTNRANGRYVPLSDVAKDIFGPGWHFEEAGVLKVDATGGYETGSWWLEGGSVLVVQLPGAIQPQRYQAQFRGGFLYLTNERGGVLVFEKNKFFGF